MPPKRKPLAERFWPKVRIGEPDECWEWTASQNGRGYGQMGRGGEGAGTTLAHRVSFELHFGPIPADLIVRHKCDNRVCVNPDHLELGTYADNMKDMYERGRSVHLSGEQSANAKLTAEQVRRIRAVPPRGRLVELAAEFGITTRHAAALRYRPNDLWRGVA